MQKLVLHCGAGGSPLPFYMQHCKEIKVDIDPETEPDILANMAELPENIGPFDAVFSSHALEHLWPHEVKPCLEGWLRVLKPGGSVILFVPDLEGVQPTKEVLYVAASGPVTGFDMYYGWEKWLKNSPAMAHKGGFVQATLRQALEDAGFSNVVVERLSGPYAYNLYGFGVKSDREKESGNLSTDLSLQASSGDSGVD